MPARAPAAIAIALVIVCLGTPLATANPHRPAAPTRFYAWNVDTDDLVKLTDTNLDPYCCGPDFPSDLTERHFAWVEFVNHRDDDEGAPASIVHIEARDSDERIDINVPEGLVNRLSLSEDTIFYTITQEERVFAREFPSGLARPMDNVSGSFMDDAIAIEMQADPAGTWLNLLAYDLQAGEYIVNMSLRELGGPVGVGLSNFNEGVAHMYGAGARAGPAAVDVRSGTVTPIKQPDKTAGRMAASGSSLVWADAGPQSGPMGYSVIYRAASWAATPELIRSPNHAVAFPGPQIRDGWLLMADYDPSPHWLPAPSESAVAFLVAVAAVAWRVRINASR